MECVGFKSLDLLANILIKLGCDATKQESTELYKGNMKPNNESFLNDALVLLDEIINDCEKTNCQTGVFLFVFIYFVFIIVQG